MNKLFFLFVLLLIVYFYFRSNTKINVNTPPNQNEIQTLQYIDKEQFKEEKIKYNDDFPYPQISNAYQKLSNSDLPSLFNQPDSSLPANDSSFIMKRDTPETMETKRLYIPDYYRKDNLPANDIGSEEFRSFVTDSEESESSWTDDNVSKHPRFYSSDGPMNKLTDIGSFFDKNNQYHDKTSNNTNVLTSDNCFINKEGDIYCDEKHNELVAPQLIYDNKSNDILNQIGSYREMKNIDSNTNRLINGGEFYDSIYPSLQSNETFSKPIQPQFGDCSI